MLSIVVIVHPRDGSSMPPAWQHGGGSRHYFVSGSSWSWPLLPIPVIGGQAAALSLSLCHSLSRTLEPRTCKCSFSQCSFSNWPLCLFSSFLLHFFTADSSNCRLSKSGLENRCLLQPHFFTTACNMAMQLLSPQLDSDQPFLIFF
jgi:hypothetical protein